MSIAEVLKECLLLPGVTAEEKEGYTELFLSCDEGRGRMRFIPLFPGVTFALISVSAPSWPAPKLHGGAPDAKGPFIVNYCIRGRCELVLNDNKSVFLTSGHISLTEKFARSEYIYPGRAYDGIELFIDQDVMEKGLPMLRDGFGLELGALRDRYCPEGGTFISKMPLPDDLARRLFGFPETESTVGMIGLKTGVIDLLALLLYSSREVEAEQLVYYTKLQVEMAKKIEAIITSDLSQQHTVREFAEMFSVSEGSIKNYFRGVYGQSIPQYVAERRMLQAAELLSETRLPVVDVAGRVGYENQSKFSAAFRRKFSLSPLEYRRMQKILTDVK